MVSSLFYLGFHHSLLLVCLPSPLPVDSHTSSVLHLWQTSISFWVKFSPFRLMGGVQPLLRCFFWKGGFVSACPLLGTQHTVCCFPWWLLLNTVDYADSLQPFLFLTDFVRRFWGSGRMKLQCILETDVTILLFSSIRLINFFFLSVFFYYFTCKMKYLPVFPHVGVLSFETLLSIIKDLYSNTVHFFSFDVTAINTCSQVILR